jgi:hypothetical protein
MKPLSQQLSELSVQAKNAEDNVQKAQSEAKERIEQRREEVQHQTKAALDKVSQNLSDASADAQARATQMKAKVNSDFEQLKQRSSEGAQKFEAWQANNYADDKEADASSAINYAIAATKMAELATLDAISARVSAEVKAEQTAPPVTA